MKRVTFLIAIAVLIFPALAKADIDTEFFSLNFQEAMSQKSPLDPPDKFANNLNPLVDSAPYQASVKFREDMRGKKMKLKHIKPVREKALAYIERVKKFIDMRQKKADSRIIAASVERLEFLSSAAYKDLEKGLDVVSGERAKAVAGAEVDRNVSRTVLNIQMQTDLKMINQAINKAQARLKKGGLTASAKQKIIKSINSLNAKKDALMTRWGSEKGKINNLYNKQVKEAGAQLIEDSKAVKVLYDQNIDDAEKSVNGESANSVEHLNNQIYIDTKRLDSLKNSLERVLTANFDRIVSLGGSQTPKLAKPKKQKVNKNKKQASKKRAAKKARQAGQKYLEAYRELLYSRLD